MRCTEVLNLKQRVLSRDVPSARNPYGCLGSENDLRVCFLNPADGGLYRLRGVLDSTLWERACRQFLIDTNHLVKELLGLLWGQIVDQHLRRRTDRRCRNCQRRLPCGGLGSRSSAGGWWHYFLSGRCDFFGHYSFRSSCGCCRLWCGSLGSGVDGSNVFSGSGGDDVGGRSATGFGGFSCDSPEINWFPLQDVRHNSVELRAVNLLDRHAHLHHQVVDAGDVSCNFKGRDLLEGVCT